MAASPPCARRSPSASIATPPIRRRRRPLCCRRARSPTPSFAGASSTRRRGCARRDAPAGDVVGITIADEVAHLTACFAAFTLGVPQVSLPTYEPPAARTRLARALGVTRVIAAEPAHGLAGIAASFATPAFLAQPVAVETQDALVADPAATALYVASSGSTGEPKVIAFSARLLADRLRLRGYPPRERVLALTTTEDIFARPRACSARGAA
jgi:acyl-CoA synthetase (AMP-forming)/AMP-acid ligase II